MNFSIIMKLCFYSLLCQRVCSSIDLLSRNDTSSNGNVEKVLEKFFVALKTAYLRIYEPRHITIVGAANNDLRQVKPLLKSYPYIICKELENCAYSAWFSRGNFAIVFLTDLSEETFRKNTEFLSRCRKCRILFVSNGNIRVDEIRLIFTLTMELNILYIEFAHLSKDRVKLYTNIITKNCSPEVRLETVWRPGMGLRKIHNWAFKLLRDLNGCPVSVSSLTFRPKMMIKEQDNGSLIIVGGREGKLLLTVAKKLNFTMMLRHPSVVDRMKYSRKMSIINDVISGIVEIGIGRLLPTNDLQEMVAFSEAYDEECVTWGIPLLTNWSTNNIVWLEFSWEVWIAVGLVFVVVCAIGYVDENLSVLRKGKRTHPGFVATVLDVLAIHLGNPAVHISSSVGGKFMLIAHLCYAMVITTAYKSYLAAILSSNIVTPMFVDVEGIVNSNITVGGSLYDYHILQEQASESYLTSKLLERFIVENNDTISMYKLKYGHDYAFLARLSSLNYQKLQMVRDQESISFGTLNNCVLSYPTVIVLKKTSLLRKSINNIIQSLEEAGILENWDLDEIYTQKILKPGHAGKYFKNYNKFRPVFLLYSGCVALCSIIFLIELLAARFDSRKRQHATNRGL